MLLLSAGEAEGAVDCPAAELTQMAAVPSSDAAPILGGGLRVLIELSDRCSVGCVGGTQARR